MQRRQLVLPCLHERKKAGIDDQHRLDQRTFVRIKGAERIFGYTAAEAIGQNVLMLIPTERHFEESNILGRLRVGERVQHFETVRRRKDGTLLDISLTISPVKDGRGTIIGASKIAHDITERKRVDAALQASEARFRHLADAMPQIVWTARPDGYID